MKKLFVLISALLIAAALLVACDGGSVQNFEDSQNDVDSEATDAPDSPSASVGDVTAPENIIVENGETDYTVVRADITSDEIIALARNVIDRIVELGEKVRLRMGTDWTKNIEETAANYEILVGNSNRPETAEVMNSIGYDDYAIRKVGNKIVIAAHAPDRLAEAVEYFCANSVSAVMSDGKILVAYVGDYHFKGDREYLIDADNPLDGYRVVSSEDAASVAAAEAFAKAVKRVYGAELEVVTDSTPAAEREIVIGNTNREISKKYIGETTAYSYIVKVEGKSVLIGSSDGMANTYAVSAIIDRDVHKYYDNTLNYAEGYEYLGIVGDFANSSELAEGADARVFSFNVLYEWDANAPAVKERSIALGAILNYFSPDVIGLQEVSESWHGGFGEMFEDLPYEVVDTNTERGVLNYSPILYNTEKVRLVDHGVDTYDEGSSANIRVASWACFETVESGKRFVVVNTHWDIKAFAEKVMSQAIEMAGLCLKLGDQFDCPVITTGDYNKQESTDEYKKFVELTGYHESKYSAKVIERAHYTYHGTLGKLPTDLKESIDHIFGSPDAEFMFFTVLVDQIVLDNSDHCPIYADIKLN